MPSGVDGQIGRTGRRLQQHDGSIDLREQSLCRQFRGRFRHPGFLKAYDIQKGVLLWTWHSIPSPEQGGWEGDWLEQPRERLDPQFEISQPKKPIALEPLKLGGGEEEGLDDSHSRPGPGPALRSRWKPSPVFDGQSRPGDNRWTASICALRIEDGELEWGFQYLPHDVWDYGGGMPSLAFRRGVRRSPDQGGWSVHEARLLLSARQKPTDNCCESRSLTFPNAIFSRFRPRPE